MSAMPSGELPAAYALPAVPTGSGASSRAMTTGPGDTLRPEEEPTDPELPSLEVLLAGLNEPPPLAASDDWTFSIDVDPDD